jgi:hypothetical protein
MQMPLWVAWLLAWIAATVAFLSIPAIGILAPSYRQARRDGIRRPVRFIASRVFTSLLWRRPLRRDMPDGRVFVEWDVRWLSTGRGLALAVPSETSVTLVFDTPQEIGTPASTFMFRPNFRRGSAVHGTIRGTGGVEAEAVLRSRGV